MIRTILIPDQKTISLDIPVSYIGKEVEIIAFSKEEGQTLTLQENKKVSFSAASIDTKGFKFNRDEANER